MTSLAFYSPLPAWHTLTLVVSNIPKFLVHHFRPVKTIFYITGPQIFQKYRSHLKIIGAERVIWSKFRTVVPQILGPHRTKFSSPQDLVPGICTPLFHAVVWKLVAIWRSSFFFRTELLFWCNLQERFLHFYFENYIGLSLLVFPTKHHCRP